ncbi:MAG: hypothetical protein ABL893_21400, partial [Hyphomicrobium sp.]
MLVSTIEPISVPSPGSGPYQVTGVPSADVRPANASAAKIIAADLMAKPPKDQVTIADLLS